MEANGETRCVRPDRKEGRPLMENFILLIGAGAIAFVIYYIIAILINPK